MKIKAAAALVLLGVLPGCSLFSTAPPDVTIQERATVIVCDTSARPDALDLKDTPPSLVLNTTNEIWGYWFDAELYAALAENLQAMKTWMTQSTSIRNKLIKCIDDHNASVEDPPAT